jgi:hypothetical protein
MNNKEFKQLLAEGEAAEHLFITWLESHGWSAKKTEPQNPDEPFDYHLTQIKSNKKKAIEIKSYGAPNLKTIFAETFQPLSETIPEYLLHPDKIDYMIYIDQKNSFAFIYDVKVFASYVRDNMKREITIARGSAKGIIIKEDCKDAGFIKQIYIGEMYAKR